MTGKRTGLASVVGCVLAVALGGCQPGGGGFITDRDFSMDFPSDWEVLEDQPNAAIMGRSPSEGEADWFLENVNVVIEKMPGGMSLDGYYSANVTNMKEMWSALETLEEADATVGGLEAKSLVYSNTMQGKTLKVLAFFLVKEKRGYVITCIAASEKFDEYKETFTTIVDSFKFD